MEGQPFPLPSERPDLWPWALRAPEGNHDADLLDWTIGRDILRNIVKGAEAENLIIFDTQDLHGQANVWATAFFEEFWDGYGMAGAFSLYRGWATMHSRLCTILAEAGLAIECATTQEVEAMREAGMNLALLRIGLNEQTQELLQTAPELMKSMWVCAPQDTLLISEDFSAPLLLDLRQVGLSSLATEVAHTVLRQARGVCGLSVTLPQGWAESVEKTRWALGQILDALKSVKGTHLILSEEESSLGSCVTGATATARWLAQHMRQECVQRGLPIPSLDFAPSPSVVSHSGLRVNIHTEECWPYAGESGGEFPVCFV